MNGLPDVSGSPIIIWAAIIVMLVLAFATVTDKGFGPISRAWYAFAKQRRTAAAERRQSAAEIAAGDYDALQDQVNRLEGRVRGLIDDQADRDNRAVEHTVWDREARLALAENGITLREPPPL